MEFAWNWQMQWYKWRSEDEWMYCPYSASKCYTLAVTRKNLSLGMKKVRQSILLPQQSSIYFYLELHQ